MADPGQSALPYVGSEHARRSATTNRRPPPQTHFAFAQVLFPTKDIGDLQTWYETETDTLSTEAKSIICKTLARKRMQVQFSQRCNQNSWPRLFLAVVAAMWVVAVWLSVGYFFSRARRGRVSCRAPIFVPAQRAGYLLHTHLYINLNLFNYGVILPHPRSLHSTYSSQLCCHIYSVCSVG